MRWLENHRTNDHDSELISYSLQREFEDKTIKIVRSMVRNFTIQIIQQNAIGSYQLCDALLSCRRQKFTFSVEILVDVDFG